MQARARGQQPEQSGEAGKELLLVESSFDLFGLRLDAGGDDVGFDFSDGRANCGNQSPRSSEVRSSMEPPPSYWPSAIQPRTVNTGHPALVTTL